MYVLIMRELLAHTTNVMAVSSSIERLQMYAAVVVRGNDSDPAQEIKEIEGVSGVHVMAYRQEEFVNEIIQASGVMRNRQQRRAVEPAATS